jgi:D-alanyl-D-alanine carboxypeptidase/D-alanyl-D-alanine-endopeptidase (penicillin-binding protein 4)
MRISRRLQAGCRGFAAFLISLNLFVTADAAAQALPPEVLDAFQRAAIPVDAVGAYVQEAGRGNILVASNSTIPMNPASVMKLVTTDAALELLGPTYTWKTQAFASGRQVGDVLHGDLIIRGSGDPKLVLENFWLFLRQIRARGIREIRGNVLLDRGAFEEGFYDPASFDGDPLKSYNAGPDALLLNYKSFAFRFLPDEVNGQVKIVLDPPMLGYKVAVPRLVGGDCGDWKAKLQGTFNGSGTVFAGTYPASCGDRTWYVHPYHMTHVQYFGSVFSQVWNDLGGIFAGQVRNGAVPPGARLVGEWESPALAEVIRDINKFSNNVMARQLLLAMAADVFKMPANPERGARAIKTWLANKGIEAPDLVIENGSGLSRNERVSAITLGRMLSAAYQSPFMPEFMSSMPLAGFDGTMRRRLNTRSVSGNAHIKTGSLNEVRSIAGYVLAASGKRYVVACIVNHRNAPAAQEALDTLLQWIYERG